MNAKKPIIEVCVDCLDSVQACAEAGADRIELCAALSEGGLTPSLGFLKAARRLFPGQIMMMIRPRYGDFLYSEGEIELMAWDITAARDGGADGVVYGCLLPDGQIDRYATDRLRRSADGLSVTFHRAFDVSRDLAESLDVLKGLGVNRVLTSGGKPGVLLALEEIRTLIQTAASGGPIILPGGGISAHDVAKVIAATGADECHLSARSLRSSGMAFRRPDIPMGALAAPGAEYERKVADSALIRRAQGA
jgi:copper homeostasis protein